MVYPNPVSGVLHFDVPVAKRRLVVRNMAGVVVDDKVDFSASSYETSHLPKGLYLVSLGSYTFKVVIE
ncbi:hypothetical protein D3C86_2029430 [compost metagenome]